MNVKILSNKKINYFLIKIFATNIMLFLLIYQGARVLWGEDYMTFFKGALRNPFRVGAVSPCSVFVAYEIIKYVAQNNQQALRVLEVGGGSGALTRELEKVLTNKKVDYILDVIEIDPEYSALLQKRFAHNKNITIYCKNVLEFNPGYQYDYIISSLPFTTMDTELITQILKYYEAMIISGGILSYVEHMWFPELQQKMLNGDEKQLFAKKRTVVNTFKDTYLMETVNVYRNITPLYVHHLQIKKDH